MTNSTANNTLSYLDRRKHFFFIFAVVLAFVFLVIRAWDVFPSVFPDEYVHSKNARLVALSDVNIPSYLYYAIYRLTGLFGDQFLNAARVLNAMFITLGGVFVYAVARRFTTDGVAMVIGVASILSPLSTYANYFMSEAMYFAFFWLFVYLVFRNDHSNQIVGGVVAGIVFGALILVKPHAMFIIHVYPISLLIVYGLKRPIIVHTALFIAVALGIKFMVGYILAGTDGLSILGNLYGNHTDSIHLDASVLAYAVPSFAKNLLGNFLTISFIYGLGFALLFVVSKEPKNLPAERLLLWMTVAFLVTMVILAAAFSTSVAVFDKNLDQRIYLRYYSFGLPLILIYASSRLDAKHGWGSMRDRSVVGGLFACLTLLPLIYYSVRPLMQPYKMRFTDMPEFFLIVQNGAFFYFVGLLSVGLIIAWIAWPRSSVRSFLIVYIPLFTIVTNYNSIGVVQNRNHETAADAAGIYLASKLAIGDHEKLLIAGSDQFQIERALFYSVSGNAEGLLFRIGDSVSVSDIDPSRSWILILDDLPLAGPATLVEDQGQFRLYKLDR